MKYKTLYNFLAELDLCEWHDSIVVVFYVLVFLVLLPVSYMFGYWVAGEVSIKSLTN